MICPKMHIVPCILRFNTAELLIYENFICQNDFYICFVMSLGYRFVLGTWLEPFDVLPLEFQTITFYSSLQNYKPEHVSRLEKTDELKLFSPRFVQIKLTVCSPFVIL